ncbi:hypothetical protein ACIA5G_52770 [Amycolatopsis sp. NPDC051758]|uniref:hypothetical protein n=1 Tax=Amycolatopsis sp. NPDC051758 TaxID=3363935 RepID=UPI0037B5126B
MTVYRTGRTTKAAAFLAAVTLFAVLPAPAASAANALRAGRGRLDRPTRARFRREVLRRERRRGGPARLERLTGSAGYDRDRGNAEGK